MKLKDVLKLGRNYETVEYRINYPNHDVLEGSMLKGLASWIHGELKSLDGDSYSLEDEIVAARELAFEPKVLVVYQQVEWE